MSIIQVLSRYHLKLSNDLKKLPNDFKEGGIMAILKLKLPRTLLTIELSVKSSKESTKTVSLLKTGNKVVEVG
jgi:hypothetical protein